MGYVSGFFAWMNDGEMLRVKLSNSAQETLDEMISASIDTMRTYHPESFGDYKIEDDEIYIINNFRNLPVNIRDTLTPVNAETIEYHTFEIDDVKAFVFPFCIDEVVSYAFQAPRKETKTLRGGLKLFLDRDTFVIDERPIITITGEIDCIASDQSIIFKSTYYIQRYFPITEYYREATVENVEQFVLIPNLSFENQEMFKVMAEDKIMRRKIALLMDQNFFSTQTPESIQENARKIIPEITIVENNHIHFPNDKKKCKQILKIFCDEVYRGTFSNAVFETNSKKNFSTN